MDQITEAMDMVDHIHQPAFCVREGIIVKTNPAARARMIEAGSPVAPLFSSAFEDYENYTGGCLYANLSLNGQPAGVSVTRKQDFDLFLLLPDSDRQDLQALALAARELREPLSGLMITSDRLFPQITDEKPELEEQVARMNRSLFQLLRIISNMADASRFEAAALPRTELRDVCAFVAEIGEKAKTLAAHAGVTLYCTVHPEPVFCQIDSEKLERALFNLLSNALKFTPAGGEIRLSLKKQGNRLYLRVQDSGCGIPETLRGDLFSRYTREPGVEDSRFGIGLGLVLIRSAAAAHGGTVLIDHPQPEGTRVTLTMAIRTGVENQLRSPIMKVDYTGEWDHALVEFSSLLPPSVYLPGDKS